METLGDRLKKLREENGLTQEDFGQLVGAKKSTMYKWERGTFFPPADVLATIAKAFHVDLNWLVLEGEMEVVSPDIGERLKKIRQSSELSQMEFARRIGVKKSTIYTWEKGTAFPPADVLQKIAEEFKISLDWLILGRGSKQGYEAEEFHGGPIDPNMLRQIIEGVELWLEKGNLLMAPDKKAELIVYFYEQFEKEGQIDEGTMHRLLRVVTK